MKEYFHAWNTVFEGMPQPFWKVFKSYSDLKYAWKNLTESQLKRLQINDIYIKKYLEEKKSGEVLQKVDELDNNSIKILTIKDNEYPVNLRSLNTHLPPLVLYVKGNFDFNSKQSLSIVGTRQMTGYGEITTKKLINTLSKYNIAITSGMARGVDITAHRTAIECDMSTIAVLGYGLKQIPYYLRDFAELITQNGAVVSEYPPCLKAQKYHFPLRNRIISGLSKATAVIEAGVKSGARITAQYALDQSRDVYAVPGNIYDEKSKGTNLLIQRASAHPLLEAEDILNSYDLPVSIKSNPKKYPKSHRSIIKHLKKNHYSAHQLLTKSSLPAHKFNLALTELELEGEVSKNKDGKYYLT
jgi:DNA processing protein